MMKVHSGGRTMICPFCQGKRLLKVRGQPQPCVECGGKGEVHCCEGLQSQPDDCEIDLPPRLAAKPATASPDALDECGCV